MVAALIVTAFPVVFLAVLSIGDALFRRRHIDMDGAAPLHRPLFYSRKAMIVAVRRQGCTQLRMGWFVCVSPNPMYLGVYATILASVLRTLNPVVFFLGVYI